MNYGDNPLLLAITVRKDYYCLPESLSSPVIPTPTEGFRLDIQGFLSSKELVPNISQTVYFLPCNVQLDVSKPVSKVGPNMGYFC